MTIALPCGMSHRAGGEGGRAMVDVLGSTAWAPEAEGVWRRFAPGRLGRPNLALAVASGGPEIWCWDMVETGDPAKKPIAVGYAASAAEAKDAADAAAVSYARG